MYLGFEIERAALDIVLLSEAGAVEAAATVPLESYSPAAGWSEQQPNDWWDSIAAGLRQIAGSLGGTMPAIKAIGVTADPGGFVAISQDGVELRPAILADDSRAIGAGASADDGLAGPLGWLKRHEPEVHDRIARVLTAKAYLLWGLTGEAATDAVDAGLTQVLDRRSGNWSGHALGAAGLTRANLPTIEPAATVAGTLLPEAADDLGLTAGIPVVVGPGQPLARHLALGDLSTPLIGFGANATVGFLPDGADFAGYRSALCLYGGLAFDWIASITQARNAAAALAEANTSGRFLPELFALPFPAGERRTATAPRMTGTLIGMSGDTKRSDVIRAVAEAVGFTVADAVESLAIDAKAVPQMAGPLADSLFFSRLLAGILGRHLLVRGGPVGRAAVGAALIARQAIDGSDPLDRDVPPPEFRVEPESSVAAAYAEKRRAWRAMLDSLTPVFAQRGGAKG